MLESLTMQRNGKKTLQKYKKSTYADFSKGNFLKSFCFLCLHHLQVTQCSAAVMTHPQKMTMYEHLWQTDVSCSQSSLEIQAVVGTHEHISLIHSNIRQIREGVIYYHKLQIVFYFQPLQYFSSQYDF